MTDATAETIWQVPAYLPYIQPPLNDAAVAQAEASLGVPLPPALLDLLRVQNGGYIRYALAGSPHTMIAGIGPHFPSLGDIDWTEEQPHVSFPLAGLIPFDGDGHYHLCLDYRARADAPSVVYVDVECDEQRTVARSFADYLAMLRVDAGDQAVVETARGIPFVVSALSDHLGVTFEGPDSWSNGVPTYRAALGTPDAPEWLWLGPNRVSRGFVRPDDPQYETLKDRLPGVGLRYPEVAESSVLLDVTDDARLRVMDACRRAGLSVRPLRDVLEGT